MSGLLPFGSAPALPATFSTAGKVRQTQYNVKDYGAKGDGSTNDSSSIQSAVDAATAAGGGIVFFPPGTYSVTTNIIPKSNVTFLGCGSASVLTTPTLNGYIINWSQSSGTVNDIIIDSLKFSGPVNQTVSVPTVGRTTSGNGTYIAVYIDGSLDTTGTFGTVTNFTMRNCIVQNTISLPIRIFGVTGKTIVTGCEFTNCKDAGWGFNQEVICIGNHSYMSADNGFSISRGNSKVTCVGNTAELSAINGIWLSGFLTSVGPTDFTCVGNTVKNVGENGIIIQDGSTYGTINGNTIDKGYYRGASDQLTDLLTCGIYVNGDSASPTTPSTFVNGLVISNNNIRGSAQAGVYLNACKGVRVSGNLILDAGTQFLADGSTAIASNNTAQNIGILFGTTSTVTGTYIEGNTIIDQRGTPYCNYGLQPTTSTSNQVFHNIMSNCRNATNLTSQFTQAEPLAFNTAGTVNMSSDGTNLTMNVVAGNRLVVSEPGSGTQSVLNLNNTDSTSSGGIGALMSAGAIGAFVGGFFATRTDASSNSIMGVRVLSNGALTGSSTSAPFYLQGATGGVTANFNANVSLATVGNKLNIATGSNASVGTGTLSGGTVTISTTAVTANSLIFLTDTASVLTNVGTLSVSAKSAGVSFTVTSANVLDTSTFNWLIIN